MATDPAYDTLQLAKSTAEVVAGQVGRYAVAIVADAPMVASGVLVSYGDWFFVATARHAIRGLPRDHVWLIPRTPEPLKLTTKAEIPGSLRAEGVQRTERRRFDVLDRRESAVQPDVALVQIPDPRATWDWVEVYPLETPPFPAAPGVPVTVYGYPEDLKIDADPEHLGRLMGFPRIVYGQIVPPRPGYSRADFDPDFQLLIEYEESDKTMTARGMSGGGVWVPAPDTGKVWPASDSGPTLVGIQVAWFHKAEGRPLIATRVQRVIDLLR